MAEDNGGGSGSMTLLGVIVGVLIVIVIGFFIFGGVRTEKSATFNIQPPAPQTIPLPPSPTPSTPPEPSSRPERSNPSEPTSPPEPEPAPTNP